MARGTANGEPVVSQASTPEYLDGHARTFGEKPIQRGKWVYDPERKDMVPADEYVPPPSKTGTGIMIDRFYEGAKATDGTDIGSRAKHRAYMRAHGLTTVDDFSPEYLRRQKRQREIEAKKHRREVIERKFYEIQKP